MRKPHLAKAQAALEAAKASLAQAQVNLTRTEVAVPFNAVVVSKSVDIGAMATTQTVLATLAGTDKFWVEAAVPVDRLKWIAIPGPSGEAGSNVTVSQVAGADTLGAWKGRVAGLLSDLEPDRAAGAGAD